MASLEEHLNFKNDPRMPCKYGSKCYQKNPVHHKKFKHIGSAEFKEKKSEESVESPLKKQRLSDSFNGNDQECQTPKEIISSSEDSDAESKEDVRVSLPTIIQPLKTQASPKETVTSVLINDEDDEKSIIRKLFLLEMPPDFYQFWDFCQELSKDKPELAFSAVGLILVGPYDVLSKKISFDKSSTDYLLHWRYYYDSPEFQTVLKGEDTNCYHIGYYRDSPDELPVFLASSKSEKTGCTLTPVGGNIFGAVNSYLEHISLAGNPFQKLKVAGLQKQLKAKAGSLQLSLLSSTPETKARQKKVVARTFHRLGIVVPYDRKTQLGYRNLYVTDKELREILDKISRAAPEQLPGAISKLDPILSAATIAADECDFGTCLELGHDLFFYGHDRLNKIALQYLTVAYNLLNRQTFSKIAEAHLSNRKRGSNVSIC